MKHYGRRIAAISLAGTMALTAVPAMAAPSPSRGNRPKNQTASASSIAYIQKDLKRSISGTVRTYTRGTADLLSLRKTNWNYTFVRPYERITVGKVSYKVTAINKEAFKNAKKVRAIVLPKTVKTVKSGAFTGAKTLKKIRLKRKANTIISRTAFKGLNTKKMIVKVSPKMPMKNYKNIKKQLKQAGFQGKIQRVKAHKV